MFYLHSSPPKLHLRSTQAPSQTHPGFNTCVKLPSWSCSKKFRWQDSCFAFIHEPSPSRSITLHLSSIEVASEFNPGPHIHISPPYKHPYILKSQLHSGHVSPQSRSWYLHFTSIPVTPHLHPCLEKCSSATPISYPKPILVHFISIQVLPHLHPGEKVLISSRSLYRLTSTHITYHILSVHEVCSSSPTMSSLNSTQSP